MVKGYRFSQSQHVRYADTDAQGHVFFGNYFVYFDEAMGGYLTALGYEWEQLLAAGLDILYVDAHCAFKASARAGETLDTYGRMAHIGNSSLRAEFVTTRAEGGQVLAEGSLTAVLVDNQSREPTRVPDEFRQAISLFEDAGGEGEDPA
jgi:acyl-CoA thioester hydrolase